MDSESNTIPSHKWWDWIVHNANEFKQKGDKILDRHSNNLEPKIFGYIHQLTESDFNNFLLNIPSIRNSDKIMKTPRVEVLGNYSIKPQTEDFKSIIGLLYWCKKIHLEFHKDYPGLKNVASYIPQKTKKTPPKCMIPPDILEKQIKQVELFRKK